MPSDNPNAENEDWSWHDNAIHGLHLRAPDPPRDWYHSQLLLDIDHIVEWVPTDGGYSWRVAPATLTFDWVSHLRLNVDFTGDALRDAVTPWSINQVVKTPKGPFAPDGRPKCVAWQIRLNIPADGEIAFMAQHFDLAYRAEPQLLPGRPLDAADRPPLVLT